MATNQSFTGHSPVNGMMKCELVLNKALFSSLSVSFDVLEEKLTMVLRHIEK